MKKRAERIIAVILAVFMCFEIYPFPVSEVMAQEIQQDTASESDATEVSDESTALGSEDMITGKLRQDLENGETPEELLSGESESSVDQNVDKEETEDQVEEATDGDADVAFEAETECDGVKIKVSADAGVFPEGATMKAVKISDEKAQAEGIPDAVGELIDEKTNIAKTFTFDITIYDEDGDEIEPNNDKGEVRVSFTNSLIADGNLETNVYHIKEENSNKIAEKLDTDESGEAVEVTTDGFSYYTVEFTYGEKMYVMDGDTTIPLSDILTYVGLTGNVTDVSVSNESLFSASNSEDGWVITAHQAFSSKEWMKVTIDGIEYEIVVTDLSFDINTREENQTGSNDYILYENKPGGFEVRGKDGNTEIATTYGSSGGYQTYIAVGTAGKEQLITNDHFYYGDTYNSNGVKVSITANIPSPDSKGVVISYHIENTNDDIVSVKLGSCADIQIGTRDSGGDNAPITMTNNAVIMTNPTNQSLKFMLVPGGGVFDTRWMGTFSDRTENVFVDNYNPSKPDLDPTDSGIAWSWNFKLRPGQVLTKTAILTAGEIQTYNLSFNANGGSGTMDTLSFVGGVSTGLPANEFTSPDPVNKPDFMGWADTLEEANAGTVRYDDESNISLNSTKTLYAVWGNKTPQTVTIPTATVDAYNVVMTYGETDKGIVASTDGDGTLSYEVVKKEGDDDNVISVNYRTGDITAKRYGVATVKVTAAETPTHKEGVAYAKVLVYAKNIKLKAKDSSKIYGNSDPNFSDIYILADGETLVPGDSIANSFTATGGIGRDSGENVGTYSITRSGITSLKYNVTEFIPGTFTINPRPITVVPEAKTITYGDADPNLTYKLKNGSTLASGDTLGSVLEGALVRADADNHNAGTYTISKGTLASKTNNYSLTFENNSNIALTINPKPVTVVADNKEKTYGEGDPELTYTATGLVGEDTLTGTLRRGSQEDAGVYTDSIVQDTLTNDQNPNYNISFTLGTFTINKKSINLVPKEKTKKYGEADPEFTYSIDPATPLKEGDSVENAFSGSLTRENADKQDVGKYTIIKGDLTSANYAYTLSDAKLTIEPKAITIEAEDKEKTYGEADEELTYVLADGSEMAYNEDIGDVMTGNIAREAGEDAGEYAIVQNTLSSTNYAITFVPGTYTIKKKPITINADILEKDYGDEDPEFTYVLNALTPLAYEDKIEDIVTGQLEREEGKDVGEYVIGKGTIDSDNYEITVIDGKLTIKKRPITIIAEDKEKSYGEQDPELTYINSKDTPLYEGDNLTEAISAKLKRDEGEKFGKYAITADDIESKNYEVTFKEGTFTINKVESGAEADVTSSDDSDKDVKMTTSDDEVLDMMLSDDDNKMLEEGAGIKVYFEITHLDQLSADEETIIKKALADGYVIGDNYDISLFKKYSFKPEPEQLFETPSEVGFELDSKLPAIPTGATREYAVVRVHNGVAEVIPSTYDSSTNTIKFASSKFSTYTIAYKDSLESSDGDNNATKVSTKVGIISTGDVISMGLVLSLIILSTLGITLTVYKKKKYLESESEE